MDKLLHLGAFGGLAALAILALPPDPRRLTIRRILIASGIAGAYAALDEFSQTIVVLDRTASMLDVACNLAGVVAVTLGALAWQWSRDRGVPRAVAFARAVLAFALPAVGVMIVLPGLNLGPWIIQPRDPSRYSLPWRNDWFAHFFGSAIALWLVAAAAPWGAQRKWLNRITSLVVVTAIAPLIELVQPMFGRGYEPDDLASHYLGQFVGVLVAAAYLLGMRQAARGAERQRSEGVKEEPKAAGAPSPPPPLAPSPPRTTSFIGGAAVVSLLTLVSRVTGLVREAVLAAAFGRGPIADAFVFAFTIPNLFRRLFGEGALSAALIPVYAGLLHRDRLTAQRLASACLGLLFIVTGVLTLVGEAVILGLLAGREWSPANDLALRLTMVMLPYMPLVCLVAVIGSVLQVHEKFASTAAAPIVLNLFIIAAALLTTGGHPTDDDLHRAVYLVASSVIVAGGVQLVWQLLAVVRVEPIVRVFTGVGDSLRSLLQRFIPTAIGLGVFQINTFLDNVMAIALRTPIVDPRDATEIPTLHLFGFDVRYPMSVGDVAGLGWAQRLYEFPLGIFGIAIATAIFPLLARAAAAIEPRDAQHNGTANPSSAPRPLVPSSSDFASILRHGLRLTVFIGLPASVGLLLCDVPLVRVILERRQFTLDDSLAVAFILSGYVPAIWAYSMNHVITRAFYSLGDTRTPLVVSTAMVALNLTLNLTLVWFLGAAGFAWSTAACAVIQCVVMLLAMRHYVADPIGRETWLGWARTAALSAFMGAALWLIVRQVDATTLSLRAAAAYLAVLVGLGMALFLGGAWVTRAAELRWLLRRS